jgi:CubicO group peptidase (beta-lactamase class C family)
MKRKVSRCLLVSVVLAALFGVGTAWADVPDLAALDAVFERAAEALGGCALVLVHDGETVYAKGFGDVGPDDSIAVASAAKWISAAALLSLVREGLLELDTPLSHLLPYLADGGDPDYKAGITLRMLLSHTSGLPAVVTSLYDPTLTLAECAERLAAFPFDTQPGRVFEYADLPMQVAGRAAEVVTGKPWADVFRERISEPLEMPGTDFNVPGPTQNPSLAVGLRSSALEYSHFLAMLLAGGTFNGRQVLAPELVSEMLKDQTRDVAPWSRQPYALGTWCTLDPKTGEPVGFSSPGTLGFTPWIDLNRNLGAVFASTAGADAAWPFYEELRKVLNTLFAPESTPSTAG